MKKILLAVSCLLAAALTNAQQPSFEWAKQMGGYSGYASGNCVARDISNNVYATGNFRGTVDFDPGAGIYYLTSAINEDDIFISKSDASGNFLWVKQIGGKSSVVSIAIDGSGNIYTTGYFEGTVDFDPGPGTVNLISAGGYDIFISKLDPSGNFLWTKQIGGTLNDQGSSIAVDGSGNVYTTGTFAATVDFDPGAGTFNLISAGSLDIFISKLNTSGNFVWAKQIGGTSSEYVMSIALDPSGNIYTTGYFLGTADFDPGTGTYNLISPYQDIFISKLNASGNFVWAKQFGSGAYDQGNAIKTDGLGNVYTTGSFQGTVDFDPGAGIFNFTSAGAQDIFISKLDASGNFVWAKQMGGTSGDNATSISLDASSNIYTTGGFQGTVDFDPGAGTFNLTSAGYGDIFISKLDASGNFVWVRQMGGIDSDISFSIVTDGSGNVLTEGTFRGKVDFDPGAATFNLNSSTNNGFYISKLNDSGNFVWAISAGYGTGASPNSIAVDLSGNIYTSGGFSGTADFDPGPGTFNLTSAGREEIFISKLDASGNFVWAKQIGGPLADYGSSCAIDASGNIYITGYFTGTVDFDPGVGIYNLTSAGNIDIFVSKLNASGNFVWAKQLGGTSGDFGNSVAIDAAGNVYTVSTFSDTADFDPGVGIFNLTSAGGNDIVISKLDASGNFVWAKQLGGSGSDYGSSIKVNSSGNVYTTGYFSGIADFDPGAGTFNLTSAGSLDIFISKLDASGNFVWAKQMGGISSESPQSISVDASGNIYTTGYFYGTSDFDPGSGTFNLTSAGNGDLFISKLDASGNFVWAKQIGGPQTEYGSHSAIDVSGNIYTTGYFTGTMDFDPGAGIFNLSAAGSNDVFISKLDDSGNFVWVKQLGGNSDDRAYSITIDASYNVYTTGTFGSGTADFDPDAGTSNLTALGWPDAFVHKMSQCTPPSAKITPAGTTTFCSGGSVVLNAPTGANKTYQWKKGANLISGATLSSYTATTGGNYKVIVTNTVTGCSKTTASPTVITVNALPTATITPQGPTTFCSGGSVVLAANTGAGLTYKWKKGSSFISGATLSNYTATTGGNYKVQVTNSNGCSKTSGNVAVSVPCKEGESISTLNNFDFTVYPNPNSGEFTIKFSTKPTSPIQIELTDEIGKVVKRFETNDETVVIKESNLANGIYWLTARTNKEVLIRKINIVK